MEDLKSHSHIVRLDKTGRLELIENNLNTVLNHWNKYSTDILVRFLAFTGEDRSGITLLTNLLIQYLETNQGHNWLEALICEKGESQEVNLPGFTLNGVSGSLPHGNIENNPGVYLWPKPYQSKSGKTGIMQIWILHVVSSSESDKKIFEQFLLLVCSNLMEILWKKKEFRLVERMENLLANGIQVDDISDSITYVIRSKTCQSSNEAQMKNLQGLNQSDLNISMKLGKFRQEALVGIKDCPYSLHDNYGNLNLAEILDMKSQLNDLVKLVIHNTCQSTFKNFLETGICQQVLQNAVCKVNAVSFASQSGYTENKARLQPRNTALKQFCLTQLYFDTRITYVTVEPAEGINGVLKHSLANSQNLPTQAINYNGSCVDSKLPSQSPTVITNSESNQLNNEYNVVDVPFKRRNTKFDNNDFQSSLLNTILESFNANLNYSNVFVLLHDCFEAMVQKHVQLPQSTCIIYKELFQQIGCNVEDYCNRLRFYFERHNVCFEKTSKLEYFHKMEIGQVISGIKTSVTNDGQTFVCNIVQNACRKLYNMYLNDNEQILALEKKMTSALSQNVRNFYNGEMEQLRSKANNSMSPEVLLHCNKILSDRCVKMFEKCTDSEGKANWAAIEIQKELVLHLQKDFLAHKRKHDSTWGLAKNNNTTDVTKVDGKRSDEACRTSESNEYVGVGLVSINHDSHNTLVIQVTTKNITMGCIREDGSPEIIRNYWNKKSTLAIIGVTQANKILYGAALRAQLDAGGKSFLTVGSLKTILSRKGKFISQKDSRVTQKLQKSKITLELLFGELINQLTLSAESSKRRIFHTLIIAIPSWITAEQRSKIEKGVKTHSKFESVKFLEENICIARSFLKSEPFHGKAESSIIVLSQNSGFVDLGMHKCEPMPLLTSLVAKDHFKYTGQISPNMVLQLFVSSCVIISSLRKFLKVLKSTSKLIAFLKTHGSVQKDLLKGFVVAGGENCKLTKERRGKYFTKDYSLEDSKLAVIEGAVLSVPDITACNISAKNIDCQDNELCSISNSPVNTSALVPSTVVEGSKHTVQLQSLDNYDDLTEVVIHSAERDSKGIKDVVDYETISERRQFLLQLCEQLQCSIDVTDFQSKLFRNITVKKVDAGYKLALSKSSTFEDIKKQIILLKKLDVELKRSQKF